MMVKWNRTGMCVGEQTGGSEAGFLGGYLGYGSCNELIE